jgi:hypothetical protein
MEHDWKNFVEFPKPIESDPISHSNRVESANKDKSITNGDIIAEAIRTHDRALQMHMDDRFKQWCQETKESPYSSGAKKYWKSLRFED